MNSTLANTGKVSTFTLVFDDRCGLVRRLASIVKLWDRPDHFDIIARNDVGQRSVNLLRDFDGCPWSLLLVDETKQRWSGPEAIPIILKNLPFGKIAAVAYILPGTMWLTRQLYLMVSRVSRNRRHLISAQH